MALGLHVGVKIPIFMNQDSFQKKTKRRFWGVVSFNFFGAENWVKPCVAVAFSGGSFPSSTPH